MSGLFAECRLRTESEGVNAASVKQETVLHDLTAIISLILLFRGAIIRLDFLFVNHPIRFSFFSPLVTGASVTVWE